MSIRRISELDLIDPNVLCSMIATSGDRKGYIDETKLSMYLFETSEWKGEENEAPSYYLSKRLDLKEMCDLVNHDVYVDLYKLSDYTHTQITNINTKIDSLCTIISQQGDSISALCALIKRWYTTNLDIPSISCTNLTVLNDIHGCALSAKWN